MATKAETFRYTIERSGPNRPKKSKPPRRDVPIDTSTPGVSATDRKAGGGSTAARNRSLHAARKGGVKLEDSVEKPSRKSTRGGKGRVISVSSNEEGVRSERYGEGHVKTAAILTLKAKVRARLPKARAQRGRLPARGGPAAR